MVIPGSRSVRLSLGVYMDTVLTEVLTEVQSLKEVNPSPLDEQYRPHLAWAVLSGGASLLVQHLAEPTILMGMLVGLPSMVAMLMHVRIDLSSSLCGFVERRLAVDLGVS